MIESDPIRERFMSLSPHLSERERRLFAATVARAAGYGGIAAVSAATGIAVSTIGRDLKELLALDRRWCTRWMEGEMTPAPVRYATTRWQRTDFGRPVSSIRFRTVTPMAASACWAAKPRARSQGPISAL